MVDLCWSCGWLGRGWEGGFVIRDCGGLWGFKIEW